MRVFHNSLSKGFRDTLNDAVSPVGETSRSRILPSSCRRAYRGRGGRKPPCVVGLGPSHATAHARGFPSPVLALRKNVSCSLQVLKDLKRHRLPMDNAGDRPPRYDKKRFLSHRGGQAPALREHRDREVSPTGKTLIYETPSLTNRLWHGARFYGRQSLCPDD